MKLYELAQNYNRIFEMAMDDEANLQLLEDTLQAIEAGIEAKTENIGKMILMLKAKDKALADEIDRLQLIRRVNQNREDWFKKYLFAQMTEIGRDKIQTPLVTATIQNSPPALKVDDENAIPSDYLTFVPERYEPNKEAIKKALKEGKEVPGAHLEQGQHLRIK